MKRGGARRGAALVVLVTGLILGVCGSAAAASVNLLENGGFEDGLAAWDATCNVMATDWWGGVTPVEGESMAVMSPLGVLDSQLAQIFDPMDYASVSVSFRYNLAAFDISMFHDFGNDKFTVFLGGEELESIALNDVFDCGAQLTTTGWLTYEDTIAVTAPISGDFSISFDVENIFPGGGDGGQLMTAFVDDVIVAGEDVPGQGRMPVPDSSSTLIILACGLLAMEGMRRFVK